MSDDRKNQFNAIFLSQTGPLVDEFLPLACTLYNEPLFQRAVLYIVYIDSLSVASGYPLGEHDKAHLTEY